MRRVTSELCVHTPVDPVGCRLLERFRDILCLVVDAGVEPKLINHVLDLFSYIYTVAQ
jgi:hypothetical protein